MAPVPAGFSQADFSQADFSPADLYSEVDTLDSLDDISLDTELEAPDAPKTQVRSKSVRPPSEGQSLTPSVRAYVETISKTIPPQETPRRGVGSVLRGVAVFLTLGAGLFLGAAFIGGVLAPETPVVTAAEPVQYDADELDVPEVEPMPLIERAAQGQDSALLELDLKDPQEKTFEEVLALAEGRERRDQQEAYVLGEKFLHTLPKDLSSETVNDLLEYAGDHFTYRQAQVALAKYPHPDGPDLLYRVTRMHRNKDEVVHLAEELLSMKEVRQNASAALAIVIDTWETTDCGDARKLLRKAARVGDSRALVHMSKFTETTGCGKGGAEDCYSCLRHDSLLGNALRAVRRRPAPR